MSDELEIRIDNTKLSPEKFLKAAESFFALIRGVAHNITGPDEPVDWSVEVAKGSAVIKARVTNPTRKSELAIESVTRGVRSLRSGVRSLPAAFTKDEVKASRVLASLVDGEFVKSIWIKNGSLPEDIPHSLVQTADAILSGETHIAFGSIEGKIDSLSDRHGFSCSVYEPNYGREIVCYFSNKEVEELAVKGFRKRVLVAGLIRYGKEGNPTSISVDSIRIFPAESELPTVEEIQAIYKHYGN